MTLNCGTAEENYSEQPRHPRSAPGCRRRDPWGERSYGHTWTCWRDTLDPHLTDLLLRVWT